MSFFKRKTYKEKPIGDTINEFTGRQKYSFFYELEQGWYTEDTAALSLGDRTFRRMGYLLGLYHMVFLDKPSVPESELWPDIRALSRLSQQNLIESFVEKMSKSSSALFGFNCGRLFYNKHFSTNITLRQILEKCAVYRGYPDAKAYMDKLIMERQIEPYREQHEHCSPEIWPLYEYMLSWIERGEQEYFPLFERWQYCTRYESDKKTGIAVDKWYWYAWQRNMEFFDHFGVPYNKQAFLDWYADNAKRLNS